jgi:hypothetical protein
VTITKNCRYCGTALQADEEASRLCGECSWFAKDYWRYDALREEGYMPYQAKLMCGLADPPDPDDE